MKKTHHQNKNRFCDALDLSHQWSAHDRRLQNVKIQIEI